MYKEEFGRFAWYYRANVKYGNKCAIIDICFRYKDHNNLKVPVVDNLIGRIYASVSKYPKLLNMNNWHEFENWKDYDFDEDPRDIFNTVCGTAHCLAGWAVHLAGEDGYALENKLGTELAASLIFMLSCGIIPDFYIKEYAARKWLEKYKDR